MARDDEVATDGLFGSAFHPRAFSEGLLSAVFLGLWAVLSLGVIVQVILPLSAIVAASPTVASAQNPDQEMTRIPEKLVGAGDSAQGRRTGSSKWILASALAGVGGRRLLAGDAVPARLDDDPLDAQSECVPCQLCLFSDALDEPTPSLRDRTGVVRPRP